MAVTAEQSVSRPPANWLRRARERFSIWAQVFGAVPFLLALATYFAAYQVMAPGTTGDEPHYLLVAQSIAFDGDVELTNDYASRERTLRVVNVFPLDPNLHAAEYKESAGLRPLHGVGLSALVAPGVAFGGLGGARLVMVLIAALLAHQIYRLLADLAFRWPYRVLAWSAVAFCMPILPFSSQIYPELPGALLAVIVLRILVRGGPSTAALALASAASAALVWLHVRYLPISFALLLGVAYVATSSHSAGVGARSSSLVDRARWAGSDLRRRVRVAAAQPRTVALPVLVPYAAVFGAFLLAFLHWYGSADPRTPYYAYSTTTIGSGGWKALYDYVLHDIFDPMAGWIPFAPVHWVGLAALACVVVWFGWPALACLAVAAGYELVLASAAPAGGWGLPARYLIIVIPLIAVPIAVAIQQIRAARVVFLPLLAGSLVFAVAAVRDHLDLYPVGERQRIVGLRSIAPAFPVTLPPEPPKTFTLAPGQVRPQAGRVERGQVVAREGRDRPGFLLYGPYSGLKSGAYEATFMLAATGARSNEAVATIEVVGRSETVLAREVVTADRLGPVSREVGLSFATPGELPIETRVYYHGSGTLRAGSVEVGPIENASQPAHLRDWPLALLWVGGTILVGWLFVDVMRRRAPSARGRREA
jgi:hypothetical protein